MGEAGGGTGGAHVLVVLYTAAVMIAVIVKLMTVAFDEALVGFVA